MSFQNKFERYEIKFLISQEQCKNLKEVMKKYMIPDKFGKSTISNIYFDTPNEVLVRRSNEKTIYKEKLRVRSYGIANDNSTVFVELKKKFNGIVYKRRVDMLYSDATNYLCKHNAPPKQTQITNEIDYFCSCYENLKPNIILSYEREAFFSKKDTNFRITFDKNILWRNYDLSLSKGTYGENLLENNIVLLEVKTALGIPLWLTDFLSKNHIYKTSFSKYGTAHSLLIHKKLLGGISVA